MVRKKINLSEEEFMEEIRCKNCGKKLAVAEGRGEIKCPRCKTITEYSTTEAREAQGK